MALADTITVQAAFLVLSAAEAAVMIAVPALFGVTRPLLLTSAIAALLDDQRIV
jgi:hypothetical protein